MQSLVVDTSVIIKWLNQDDEKYLDQANQLLRDVQSQKVEIFAPDLAKYEVSNALLKGKKLTPRQYAVVNPVFLSLPIIYVHETAALSQSCYSLAHKFDLTYSDAAFLAVADRLESTLITDNVKHQCKCSSVKVVELKDYSEYIGSK